MGFTMLTLVTDDGFVYVNEGDVIVREADGRFRVEPAGSGRKKG